MRKNWIILFVALLLIAISVTLLLARKSGTFKSADKDFAVSDTANVNKIFMANKDAFTVLLERNQDKAGWNVNGQWEASSQMIDLLLTTICRIRAVSPLPKAATENVIKRLAYNATKVEIYGTAYRIDFWGIKLFPHEKMLKCYYVGDVTQDNLGTYMIKDGSEIPFIVMLPGFRGYVASRYEVLANTWRSHLIFGANANEIENIKIENYKNPNDSYVVNTNVPNGKFEVTTLSGEPIPYKLDSLKVYNYLNSFRRINFEMFATNDLGPQGIDSILHTEAIYSVALKQKNLPPQHLKIFPIVYNDMIDLQTNDDAVDASRCYAYMDNGEMVVIQNFTFDKILRPLSYFYLQLPKNKR